jgi:hypothetical protein
MLPPRIRNGPAREGGAVKVPAGGKPGKDEGSVERPENQTIGSWGHSFNPLAQRELARCQIHSRN